MALGIAPSIWWILILLQWTGSSSFYTTKSTRSHIGHDVVTAPQARRIEGGEENLEDLSSRRRFLHSAATGASPLLLSWPQPASAASTKSRTDGYPVQHTEREWSYMLSGAQYNILRQGGTERPYSSVLESEERPGTYVCAGCGTPLFVSEAKFHSGTGWPSFASALDDVEVENVNPIQANLAGAELRCGKCGGHLGDVFNDGMLFVGTEAFKTGKRFCIDGGALLFQPEGGGADIVGDTAPPRASGMPSFLQPPKITPR